MPEHNEKMLIANRLRVSANMQAILWDMDGVLLDSLGFAFNASNQLLSKYFSKQIGLDRDFIHSIFAYDTLTFWRLILSALEEKFQVCKAIEFLDNIHEEYEEIRRKAFFITNPGIHEILEMAKIGQLKMAVVSNNPTKDVETILTRSEINGYFDAIIGNDVSQFRKKPSPDTYLFAAQILGVQPENCVVIEDSLIGVEAGHKAGCYTIGVATGGVDFETLNQTNWTNEVYTCFGEESLDIQFGNVREKSICTPNEFISHMVEHIAWRLCAKIDLNWYNDDWFELGKFIGKKVRTFDPFKKSGAALGMIDDGSAEAIIEITKNKPKLVLESAKNIDLNWFLKLRCEQLQSGESLVQFMEGLVIGANIYMRIRICSVEDAHHSWEGIFRSIGITLSKLFTPWPSVTLPLNSPVEVNEITGGLKVVMKSLDYCKVIRETAESSVILSIDFSKQQVNFFSFNVGKTINVTNLYVLLEHLANEAGFTLQVKFNATVLSSSHVVLEDTALVLGRALLEILVLRMEYYGVNGAGSSIQSKQDFEDQPIRVGISVEGRKFWKFVPLWESFEILRKSFLVGHDVYGSLRSEDLDDFIDGLAGGLACSIMIHVKEVGGVDQGWQEVFDNLGKSLREVFSFNPYRKGVPPGVKATLI